MPATEAYSRAGHNLLRGQYSVSHEKLPAAANQSSIDGAYTDAEVARLVFPLPKQYEHLAWWTYHAFCEEAQSDRQPSAIHARYFSTNGPGFIGMFEMTQYLAIITNVYHRQAGGNAVTNQDRIDDIRAIAMRSGQLPNVIAKGPGVVSTHMEQTMQLRDFGNITERELYRNYNDKYLLADGPKGAYVTENSHASMQERMEAVTNQYERAMNSKGKTPDQKVGCLAVKIAATRDTNVFDAMWHGIVLAGTNQEIVGQHLYQLDDMVAWRD